MAQTATMTAIETAGRLQLRSGDRVAVVAGSGRLPLDLAENLAAHGHKPFVVMVRGEARLELASYDNEEMTVENFAGLAPLLKRRSITYAVFAGGISRRPKLTASAWCMKQRRPPSWRRKSMRSARLCCAAAPRL